MIFDEKLFNYLEDLLTLRNDDTDQLFYKLKEKKLPIIYRSTAVFLEQLIMMNKTKTILEFGTNFGYSAICMAKTLPANGKLSTIEFRNDHIQKAKKNIEEFDLTDKITILEGRAEEIIEGIDDKFDLIFIDADKKGYPLYLDFAQKHLNPQGIIAVDNLLWKGSVYSDDEKIKSKPSVKTISQFNLDFMKLKKFSSLLLPIGDGLGVAVKRE